MCVCVYVHMLKSLKESVVSVEECEHINILRMKACCVHRCNVSCCRKQALWWRRCCWWCWMIYWLYLLCPMKVDSLSWTEDSLKSTSRPPSEQFHSTAPLHSFHHWHWSLMTSVWFLKLCSTPLTCYWLVLCCVGGPTFTFIILPCFPFDIKCRGLHYALDLEIFVGRQELKFPKLQI